MAKYQIIIADADLAHAREIHRHVEANVQIHGEAHRPHVERLVRARLHTPRTAGTVHDEADTDCPLGRPNCRNCGDPTFAESCAKAGHCPDCGTKHGVAPDSVVAANGYILRTI